MAQVITDSNFDSLVRQSGIAMIDFWATWCGPCVAIGPTINALASEYEGRVLVGKMNVDENSTIPTEFGIRSIPAILFFKDGKVVDKQIGAVPKSVLENKLKSLLN